MPDQTKLQAAYQETTSQWQQTLLDASNKGELHWSSVLKRLFVTLSHARLSTRENSMSPWVAGSEMPIAALFDSGSNTNIQLPPSRTPYAFFNWLMTGLEMGAVFQERNLSRSQGDQKAIYPRAFATHDVIYEPSDEQLTDGSPKMMSEKKLAPYQGARYALRRGTKSRHFGMDIGFDGEKANGENGHIYFHFNPPTETEWGSLMISCETSAPGHKNRFGKKHGVKAESSHLTLSGMPKPSVDGQLTLDTGAQFQVASRYDCAAMTVDAGVLQHLVEKEKSFQVSQLALPNTPTAPNPKPVTPLVTPSIWQRFFHWLKSWFVKPVPPETSGEPAQSHLFRTVSAPSPELRAMNVEPSLSTTARTMASLATLAPPNERPAAPQPEVATEVLVESALAQPSLPVLISPPQAPYFDAHPVNVNSFVGLVQA